MVQPSQLASQVTQSELTRDFPVAQVAQVVPSVQVAQDDSHAVQVPVTRYLLAAIQVTHSVDATPLQYSQSE